MTASSRAAGGERRQRLAQRRRVAAEGSRRLPLRRLAIKSTPMRARAALH